MAQRTKKASRNPLAWVRKLREAGTIVRRAERADDILESIALSEQRIAFLKADLRKLVKETDRAALAEGWTAEEIADAKRKATPHAAVPSHEKGEPGTFGALPWCMECFADVTDPVHAQ